MKGTLKGCKMQTDDLKVRKARRADYLYWLQKEDWDPTTAAILLAGYEPEESPHGELRSSVLTDDTSGILRLIIEAINSGQLQVRNTPDAWIAWFKGKELHMPQELSAVLIQAVKHTPEEKQAVESCSGAIKPWLVADLRDPQAAYGWYTPARYFARQLVQDDSTLLGKRKILADKVALALENVGIRKRGGKHRFDSGTVLKAFSNVDLG